MVLTFSSTAPAAEDIAGLQSIVFDKQTCASTVEELIADGTPVTSVVSLSPEVLSSPSAQRTYSLRSWYLDADSGSDAIAMSIAGEGHGSRPAMIPSPGSSGCAVLVLFYEMLETVHYYRDFQPSGYMVVDSGTPAAGAGSGAATQAVTDAAFRAALER